MVIFYDNKSILNRRILSNVINFIASIYFIGAVDILVKSYISSSLFYLSCLLGIFVYFGIIPKLTNGYTFGGFITQMRLFTLDKSSFKIIDLLRRVFDIFVFYWKTIYTKEIKVNNLHQWELDIKYNITLLPNDFDLKTLDEKENWKEVDYYFFFFPTVFKNFFLVMFIFMIIDYIYINILLI